MIFDLKEILKERIMLLDGGLGTMVQSYGLGEEDYRGDRFAQWPCDLKGCNDLLVLTREDVISEIHTEYLRAGADIITTDTFNANAVSMADYGLEGYVYEMACAAARVARRCADEFTLRNPSKPRFVAGSIGPTNKTASMSADVDNPEARSVDFDTLVAAYSTEIEGLVDGGANLLIIETCFDTLNCKAAIFAAEKVFDARGVKLPMIVSGTLTNSGRMLAGQSVEAFYTSVKHARPLAVSLNCSFGAKQLHPYLKRLAEVAECPVAVYPNAGLPNLSGGYDETPAMMAADVEEYMRDGLVNIVGGCCGTTPLHIAELAKVAARHAPRTFDAECHHSSFSGLDRLEITEDSNFINIGERTNVSGSAKFARLIREEKFDEALSVARSQVENGAQIIDICFDDGMIDGKRAMHRFLNLASAEPDIARVPFMIDSSSWDVLETGLKCVQGKSIVNSISLKEGEEEFVRRATLIRRYGAAAVVMLFDECGQADTFCRKTEVARRAYDILMRIGFDAHDIIFDPNVLAVATGIEAHNRYGIDFIDACGWIRENLPGVNISGGVSNLSFAFRGINPVRQALHSVFLYHAIQKGMNMGIVNPAMVTLYDDIEPELLTLATDVVLATDSEAGERLAAYAQRVRESEAGVAQQGDSHAEVWRGGTPKERIAHAMLKGITEHIETDVMDAYRETGDPLKVIDDCFMPAMAQVGELFGSGKMFLPQVVKSARVMKLGVGVLTPMIESGKAAGGSSGRVIMATVKGDVHDIGKNIVAVVMGCNGYEVNDLGVMVDRERIADTAQEWHADAVGLSGLITPSLEEMIKVIEEFEKRGLRMPILIGGATTSPLHTAVKMAPLYSGLVVYGRDASETTQILNRLMADKTGDFVAQVKARQAELRKEYARQVELQNMKPFAAATANRHVKVPAGVIHPRQTGIKALNNYTTSELRPYIDWSYFFNSWSVKGRYPEIFDHPERGAQARRLFEEANAMLDRMEREKIVSLTGVVGIFRAEGSENDITVTGIRGERVRMAQLRNQTGDRNLSLADYVADKDYVCLFALSAGVGLSEFVSACKRAGNDYDAIMAKLLADRLTEAFAQLMHLRVRRGMWGFEKGAVPPVKEILQEHYQGVRVAFGYPSCPDHSLKREVFDLLDVERQTPLRLTDSYMISPGESMCGMIFADADAEYFAVGRIDGAQLADYAARRGLSEEEIRRIIPNNI